MRTFLSILRKWAWSTALKGSRILSARIPSSGEQFVAALGQTDEQVPLPFFSCGSVRLIEFQNTPNKVAAEINRLAGIVRKAVLPRTGQRQPTQKEARSATDVASAVTAAAGSRLREQFQLVGIRRDGKSESIRFSMLIPAASGRVDRIPITRNVVSPVK